MSGNRADCLSATVQARCSDWGQKALSVQRERVMLTETLMQLATPTGGLGVERVIVRLLRLQRATNFAQGLLTSYIAHCSYRTLESKPNTDHGEAV